MKFLGEALVFIVPFIIPAFLIASWLVNTKTPTGGSGDSSAFKPKEKKSEAKQDEPKVSDQDMTAP